MLYALLCSIALRPVKDWLVSQLDTSLSDPRRSVAAALLQLAALPLTALVDAWEEGRGVLAKWRAAVQEEFQRRQAQLKRGAAATPASPHTPRTAAAAAAAAATAPRTDALQTMPSLAMYGHAAVRVLKSRWGCCEWVGGGQEGRRPVAMRPCLMLLPWVLPRGLVETQWTEQ